jgi:hypothetical protein
MSTSIDTMSANRISTRTVFYVSSLLILPVLYLLFYVGPFNSEVQRGDFWR